MPITKKTHPIYIYSKLIIFEVSKVADVRSKRSTLQGMIFTRYGKMNITTSNIEEFTALSENKRFRRYSGEISQFKSTFSYKTLGGKIYEEIFPDFKVSLAQLSVKTPLHISFATEKDSVEMHFTLQGSSLTSMNHLKGDFQIDSAQHHIFYNNSTHGDITIAKGSFFCFEVLLSPSFITKYLPNNVVFTEFTQAIRQQRTAFLKHHNYTISYDMRLLIESMIYCKFCGHMRKLFFESKVLELLLLQLNQVQKEQLQNTSSAEEERMYFAKELIKNNIHRPLTLKDISKQIGTNECSLKKNFKEVFGKTVFQFVLDEKMNRAQRMLKEGDVSISEIASIVGYKNPQHFSTAFKRKYGVSPRQRREAI